MTEDLLREPGVPKLRKFDWIVVNSSAGKDSQTALAVMVDRCRQQLVPKSRIVVSHQDLGNSEWPGTKELAKAQADWYGLRFEVSARRTKQGDSETLLEYVKRRGKWPDNKNRFCTSDFKRGPGGRVLTKLAQEARKKGKKSPLILNVFGFRAEESPARKKKEVFAVNKQFDRPSARIYDFLPIHDWSEKQVWDHIKWSEVPYHPAYDLGMPRLSCTFCIFAPKNALMIAGKARPELLNEYVELEREIGHDFQNGKPLADIQEALNNGEEPDVGGDHGQWNM